MRQPSALGELGELALEGGLETQYNITFWNACCQKDVAKVALSAVVLDPYLSVANINMDNHPMNSVLAFPPDRDDLIMIVYKIKNKLHLYLGWPASL